MIIHFGISDSRNALCQVMTMTNANRIQAAAMVKAVFDQTHFEYFAISPRPHQAANTNRSCQQNGLKYQVVPGG